MSFQYSLVFLLLAAGCVVAGLLSWDASAIYAVGFLYSAGSFLFLSIAYAGIGPGLFFKQSNGKRSVWGWLLFAPYFVLNAIIFRLHKALSKEPAFVQVSANLFLGRRLSSREASYENWVHVLDVAGEFSEVSPLRKLSGYRSMPILDATAPSEKQLRDIVVWLGNAISSGPVYVHCALGHGRSACLVIAYLLSSGEVTKIADGAKLIRQLRPGVRLNETQRRALRSFETQAENKGE